MTTTGAPVPGYKRCPQCGQMNRDEVVECYECGSVIPDESELPLNNPDLPTVAAQKLTWDLSLGSLIQQTVELYFRTFPRLLVLLIALSATSFVYIVLSLVLMAISPWFFLVLAPIGLVMACSYWSGHLCMLVDAVRGNSRPIPQMVSVGFLRGMNLAFGMMLIYMALFVLTTALTVSAGPLGMLPLGFFLFVVSVWAFPYLPVMVLEGRGPFESLFRAVDLTENFRFNIFMLMCLNVVVSVLLQVATLAVLGGANAAVAMMGPEDVRALIPMALGCLVAVVAQIVLWSLTTVMAFVVFWKRTNGDKVGLYL